MQIRQLVGATLRYRLDVVNLPAVLGIRVAVFRELHRFPAHIIAPGAVVIAIYLLPLAPDCIHSCLRKGLAGHISIAIACHINFSFQRLRRNCYSSLPQPRRNAFQNLAEGSDLWHSATGKRYSDYLDSGELVALTRFFQQRHLLAHTQGLADADYIARIGDTAYRVGQRLVIREASVRECLALIEKLATAMATDLNETEDKMTTLPRTGQTTG
ncbi:MAG: hypothetical protein L0Y57_07485 [Beijerinckiaceae bacterium]|nr:hypothetical protein [Beijerinckiaceae bacterium]